MRSLHRLSSDNNLDRNLFIFVVATIFLLRVDKIQDQRNPPEP